MARPSYHPSWNRPHVQPTGAARQSIPTKDGELAWDPDRRGTGRNTWRGTLNGSPITDAELVVRGLFAEAN